MPYLSLTKDRDFDFIYKKGRGIKGKFLSLRFIFGVEKIAGRCGIVVGTKVSKKATDRNLLKRRIREIIRKKINLKNKKTALIVIVFLRAVETPYSELEKELIFLCQKAGII
ncbi:ribonuclease P protein component [Candidatus Microgenomates bacterium]|nr:ribonuclease P protein component [Candidatus Microgenomates bacterium]